MVKRNMIHTKRMPEMLSDVTAQPIMFVLLFAFVFGASIATGGSASYREFLLPGIQAQTIVFTAFVVASGITADVEKGIIDRFRSLPISRSSVLIGRSVASLMHSSIGVVVMAATGLAIGWRIRGSVAEAALAFLLILLFGFSMIWFGILIGSVMRSVEAVNGVMLVAPAVVSSGTTAVASAQADPCPAVQVVFARGTGEPEGIGRVGDAFVDALQPLVKGKSVASTPSTTRRRGISCARPTVPTTPACSSRTSPIPAPTPKSSSADTRRVRPSSMPSRWPIRPRSASPSRCLPASPTTSPRWPCSATRPSASSAPR
jgi:hypothetical protein